MDAAPKMKSSDMRGQLEFGAVSLLKGKMFAEAYDGDLPGYVEGVDFPTACFLHRKLCVPLYMPSEPAMKFFYDFNSQSRRHWEMTGRQAWKCYRRRAEDFYKAWSGDEARYRFIPENQHERLIRRVDYILPMPTDAIPTADEIAAASELVRDASDNGNGPVQLILDICSVPEPIAKPHLTEAGRQIMELQFPWDAAGIMWMADFLALDPPMVGRLARLAIDLLAENRHAWDSLDSRLLYLLDFGLTQIEVYNFNGVDRMDNDMMWRFLVELRSLITELLEIRLPNPPPYINHHCGMYTVLPGDFRLYTLKLLREMPQMPGATGKTREVAHGGFPLSAWLTHGYGLDMMACSVRYMKSWSLAGWGEYMSINEELEKTPLAQATEAENILWCTPKMPCIERKEFSRLPPVQRSLDLRKDLWWDGWWGSPPHGSVAALLRISMPVDIAEILELSLGEGRAHRTVIGGETVRRAIRMTRLGSQGDLGNIEIYTTRSELEMVASLAKLGFEPADPSQRALSRKYGMAGYFTGRSSFDGTGANLRNSSRINLERGSESVSVFCRLGQIPDRVQKAALFDICGAFWAGRAGGWDNLFDPYHNANHLRFKPTLDFYREITPPDFYPRILRLAEEGLLPDPDTNGGGFWSKHPPTDLESARIFAAHAREDLWEAKYYLAFMENRARARSEAKRTPRTMHAELRAAFEMKERETLADYLREGANYIRSRADYPKYVERAIKELPEGARYPDSAF
jgi:hypothetical protein